MFFFLFLFVSRQKEKRIIKQKRPEVFRAVLGIRVIISVSY